MDNFTIYPVHWDYKKNKKQLYTIKIAITVDRQTTYLLTPHRVHPNQWQKADDIQQDPEKPVAFGQVFNHPNAKWINADILRRITEKQRDLIGLGMYGTPLTKETIHDAASKSNKKFSTFAKEVRDHRVEIPRILNFGGQDLLLRHIDVAFLRRFESSERARVNLYDGVSPAVCENTIAGTMKYFCQIMSQAFKEKLILTNPFDSYKGPRYVDPEITWLEEDDKELLWKWIFDDIDSTLKTTAAYFLLGCYAGLRHSDWSQFNPETMIFSTGHGTFFRLRATKNDQDVVMPVGPTLLRVFELLKEVGRPYSLEKSNIHLKVIGPAAGIKKILSTHVGRHSFGYLCASLGLPKSVTAELMGITVKMVEVYYHLTGQNIIKQAAAMVTV